mgnify:CR=1 FL=1
MYTRKAEVTMKKKPSKSKRELQSFAMRVPLRDRETIDFEARRLGIGLGEYFARLHRTFSVCKQMMDIRLALKTSTFARDLSPEQNTSPDSDLQFREERESWLDAQRREQLLEKLMRMCLAEFTQWDADDDDCNSIKDQLWSVVAEWRLRPDRILRQPDAQS